MANAKASIITIGDELLIGQTIDTNSAWISQRLNDFGMEVIRRVAVGDDAEAIRKAIDEELPRVSVLLITGGLGPTADDITKPLLTSYFGGSMVTDERVLEHVKGIFEKRKRPMLDVNLKQAEVPDSCTVLFNRMGTAPGMLFEKEGRIVIAMPGVPYEMMAIMEDEVIPRLRMQFVSDALVHRSIITVGEGESFLAERIKYLEAALPAHIKLAYLPSPNMVRLRLTGKGKDEIALVKEIEMRQEEIANRLEDIVVSLEDLPMEHIIGRLLLERKATVGLAESCTGGNIAHLITQIMGSAHYFNGGIVCYQNFVKEEVLGVKKETLEAHGAVSEETAIEMAKGALKVLKSTYALGITGLLSPGGEDDRVPVGTIWIAVADKDDVRTCKFKLHYDRTRNKEVAVQMSLVAIWKFIHGKL
ncbi:MAG: CinA family nicotinamide mononucleotide deamidase-related protein [Sphingobacteriales bacterium]|nr:MAG: CinA family nicotinamide mononucleotide deamidase-related protein [Sphingobacteriales bacterium]